MSLTSEQISEMKCVCAITASMEVTRIYQQNPQLSFPFYLYFQYINHRAQKVPVIQPAICF
jgi:hypothetical protein